MRTHTLPLAFLGALGVGLLALPACDAAGPGSGEGAATADGPDPLASIPDPPDPLPREFKTYQGITPRLIEGNVSGDADAVCSTEAVVGAGNAYHGIKVESPPVGRAVFDDFTVSVTRNRMYLGWRATGDAEVRHIVVKGGPDTHVYDYDGSLYWDSYLHGPPNGGGNCPEISWYAICYTEAY